MSKSEIYLYIGRAVIAIYLFVVFILVLAETIERSNIGSTEPSNYKETVQVMSYVKENLLASPIATLQVYNAATANSDEETLYEWEVSQDWCFCKDATSGEATSYPYLGACTSADTISRTSNCTQWSSTSIELDVWKGATLSLALDPNWSFPVRSNYTCSSTFDVYQTTAGLCRRQSQQIITQIKTVNVTDNVTQSVAESAMWSWAGDFAGTGNSTPPILTMLNTSAQNRTINSTNGLNLYYSYSLSGSPYLSVEVSRNGMPCLNPSNTPPPQDYHDWYPLTGNASTGCGYWNTSDDLYELIDIIVDWNFFLNNDMAQNDTFFEDLYGFVNSTINESSYLYAERKLIVNDTDFCYQWVQNPDAESNIEDIPNLNSMRSTLSTVGFIVIAIAVVAFIAYLIATRSSKTVSKESVGIYIFWFEHGLGCLYAVVAV